MGFGFRRTSRRGTAAPLTVLPPQGSARRRAWPRRGLYFSEKTVKAHVSSILRKLGVHSLTQAALHAVRAELVSVKELGDEPW